jgi:hypothetical protein
MVQAEAANLGWLAGFCDTAGWYVAIATTTISVTSLSGHDTAGRKPLWCRSTTQTEFPLTKGHAHEPVQARPSRT